MNTIRFACRKCGQRLSCEPPSLGTRIPCPACKQDTFVPTLEILDCFQILELSPRATLNEVRQAHLERVKLWHPDRFTNDPAGTKQAAEKTRELNRALELIGAYFAGTYTEARPASKPKDEPRPQPESKARLEPESVPRSAPERRPEPKPPQPATSHPALAATASPTRPWVKWAIVGSVAAVMLALIAILVLLILQRGGPTLTDESNGSQWLRAKEGAKRAYAHYILVEFEQKGMLRKTGLRINDDFFYDGIESLCRDKNAPDNLETKLLDLSQKLVAAKH